MLLLSNSINDHSLLQFWTQWCKEARCTSCVLSKTVIARWPCASRPSTVSSLIDRNLHQQHSVANAKTVLLSQQHVFSTMQRSKNTVIPIGSDTSPSLLEISSDCGGSIVAFGCHLLTSPLCSSAG